jgi:hypothetical protein
MFSLKSALHDEQQQKQREKDIKEFYLAVK